MDVYDLKALMIQKAERARSLFSLTSDFIWRVGSSFLAAVRASAGKFANRSH